MFWLFLGKLQNSFLTITREKVSNFCIYPSRCKGDCDKTYPSTVTHSLRREEGEDAPCRAQDLCTNPDYVSRSTHDHD